MAARRSSKSAASTGKMPQKTTGSAGRKPGSGVGGRPAVLGDGVADGGVGDFLDRAGEEAELARAELAPVDQLGREDADLVHLVDGGGPHHADLHALLELAVDDAHQHDDAEIGVVPGIDEQRLQRRVGVALRRRQPRDDRLQHLVDALAGLGGDRHRVGGVEADDVLDLLLDPLRLGRRQVDLVEDRDDLVVVVDRLIDVGERLRLDALGGVDDQQRALAGGQRPVHLIGEIDVAGRVDEVEDVVLAVLGVVVQAHGLRLDGDAALALDIHGIEHLRLHLPLGQAAGHLDEPVGERRLAVVDMGDDGEVADVALRRCCHGAGS